MAHRPLGRRLFRWALPMLALAAACDCRGGGGPVAGARSWPEADALFRQEPRWLGGDGAYSVDLGGERTLWLFGDSFVATSAANVRTETRMIRNTVAIMDGRDPLAATMRFHWRTGTDGLPGPFFEDLGEDWHWPGHGIRLDGGPLLLFLVVVRASDGGLGFEEAGWRAVRVPNPDDAPLDWTLEWIEPPRAAFDPTVAAGISVVREGDHVYALTSGQKSRHTGWLVRWPTAAAAAGDLSSPQWWTGGGGWVAQAALSGAPEVVLDEAGSEASLHFEPRLDRWVHVRSRGFGDTTIAMRTAAHVTGKYSSQVDVFTAPESKGPKPFVYAAKAHPQLRGRGERSLLATYATNSFEFGDLFTEEGAEKLYWPRFVELDLQP